MRDKIFHVYKYLNKNEFKIFFKISLNMLLKGTFRSKRKNGKLSITSSNETLLINFENLCLYNVNLSLHEKHFSIYKSYTFANKILIIKLPKTFKELSSDTYIQGKYELTNTNNKIEEEGVFLVQMTS
jgi:hypothetical protein